MNTQQQETIERLLDQPYCLVDILPYRVPADSKGQYFEVEHYFLQPTQTAVLSQKFAHMLLRLNCYLQMDVVQFPGETSVTNPPPAQLRTWLSDCLSARHPAIQTLFVLIPETESMFSICQEDTYMTLYNPSPSLQRLASQLAQAEGLFLWSPADGE